MKIGQFAKKHTVTIDTIRHYMDLQLLVPLKEGGQFDFDDKCDSDLEDILLFKEMGFTLNEIKSLILIKRYNNMSYLQNNEYYKTIFKKKIEDLKKQLNELNQSKVLLETKLEQLASKDSTPHFVIGIPLHVLSLIMCHKCHSQMTLSNGQIEDNQIISGSLKCQCGMEYEINDGILIVSKRVLLNLDLDEVSYVLETPNNYLNSMFKGNEWLYKQIDFHLFENKSIIDLGTGHGFFLRSLFEDLPDNCVYFAIDLDFNRMMVIKKLLENADVRKNVVLICTDFLELPLELKSVDIVIDIYGSSSYTMNNVEFLLNKIDHYFKEHHYLYGAYTVYKTFSSNSIIPSVYRKNLLEQNILNYIKLLNYHVINLSKLDLITDGGKYEEYVIKGDKMYGINIVAKK